MRGGTETYEIKEHLGECFMLPLDAFLFPSKMEITLTAEYGIISDEINVSLNFIYSFSNHKLGAECRFKKLFMQICKIFGA